MSTLRTDTLQTTDSSYSIDVVDLASQADVDSIRNSSEIVVANIVGLKALLKTGGLYAKTEGYYTAGDGGGADFRLDLADTTSVDNGGSIIVATDGGRWKMLDTSEINVKTFGAKGDGVTDDTLAIQAAFNSLGGGQGTLRFPSDVFNYTLLNFDSATGLHLVGEGAINSTILRCVSTLASDGIKLRSTFDCTMSLMTLDHATVGFTGYLVDVSHKPATLIDTQGMFFERVTFASQGFNKYTAKGINLDQATLITFDGCKFVSLLRPIDGQNPTGGSYSNGVRILNCQFADNVGYALNFLGEQWTIQDTNFQACQDGAQRIAFSDNVTVWQQLAFINNGVYDATLAGPSYLNLGTGNGLNIIGGMWGGRSDLGTSTFLNASGIITGINCKASRFSLFTNVFVAGVGSQAGWDLSGGNYFVSCTTILANPNNVISKSLDLNFPESSLGTLPIVDGAASVRYNQDLSIEMTGAATVISGTPLTVTFSPAFPLACWDVQLTGQTLAAGDNVASLVAAPTKTGFQITVSGAGSNTIRWRAIGR